MTRNAQGDLRLATYERAIAGLLVTLSTIACALSGWALLTLVEQGKDIAVLKEKQTEIERRLSQLRSIP